MTNKKKDDRRNYTIALTKKDLAFICARLLESHGMYKRPVSELRDIGYTYITRRVADESSEHAETLWKMFCDVNRRGP